MLIRDFYTISDFREEGGQYHAQLRLNKDHELFSGHFPGNPVTPGVVLMQLFKEAAQKGFGQELQLIRASNVKFMAVVNPGKDPELVLEFRLKEQDSQISLSGLARNGSGNAMKISALYRSVKNQ